MEVPSDILSRYVARREKDLELCYKSLKDWNFNELEKVGHQLKGNGETFGHPELSVIGRNLESAAERKNQDSLIKAVSDLSDWVQRHRPN